MINLNVHSHASLLYSSVKIDQLLKRVKELNQSAVALTDYGTLCNSVYFYKEANKAGIKPILGVDFFFVDDCVEYNTQKIRSFNRLIVIAENNIGWKNLNRLVSESNNDLNYFYKPRIDFNLLDKYKEGLIVLSGGLDGVIANLLYNQLDNDGNVREVKSIIKAEALIRRFIKIIGKNNFFLEVQAPGNPVNLEVNDILRSLAQKYSLNTIATNNVHYVNREDCDAHRTLLAMNNEFAVKTTSIDFNYDGYYLRGNEEMKESFTLNELTISEEIASRCNVLLDLKKRRLPKYSFIPANTTSQQHLTYLANAGLKSKGFYGNVEYQDRLNRELKDIHDMGFDDYFLIVHDVVNWCASKNILMGYGRGSAGGSLVSYCLGITNIDPVKYKLIWERFLNKGRGGLPDIDTDVPRSKRQEVLNYIRERFSNNNVAQIVTYNKLAARAVLKDVLKVYGVPFDEANKITSLIPIKNDDHGQIDLADAIQKVPELQEYELRYKPWFAIARALEGCYKSIGTHAAAVVISDIPFNESDYPLCRSSDDKSLVFALDMQSVDTLNLLKLDILGLNTLDDIQITRDLILKRKGDILSREDIPLDDEAAFRIFEEGRTVGVFQLEKQLGKNWSKGVKPKSVEEISDLVSIIRPGPLDSGMGDEYKAVKAGDRLPNYIHPLLKSILDPTYGGCLYQEQIIEICKQLAGMSLIDADHVRKAMGKKKPEEMAKWKEVFIKGCLETNRINRDISENIWSFIETFAGYGFCKSHGLGYALLAYETAYLKANHPTEFFCAKLRNATYSSDTAEEVRNIVNDAKLFNIKISPPQLSKGYITFDIIDDHTIAFGLSALKGIGEKAIVPLLQLQGKYNTFDEFLWLTNDIRINRGTIEALMQGGAFDEMGMARVQMMARYNLFSELTDNELLVIKNDGKNWPHKLEELADDEKCKVIKSLGFKIPNVRRRETIRKLLSIYNAVDPFDSKMQKIAWEKYYLGIALSGNESDLFKAKDRCSDVINFASEGRRVELSIFVEGMRKIKTKKGEDMAFVTGGDHTYTLDNIVVFPRQYNQYANLLLEGAILKLRGNIDNRGSVLVDTLERIR